MEVPKPRLYKDFPTTWALQSPAFIYLVYLVHIRVSLLAGLCTAQTFTMSHFDPLLCDIIAL